MAEMYLLGMIYSEEVSGLKPCPAFAPFIADLIKAEGGQ